MREMLGQIEEIFRVVVEYCIILLEGIGAAVIITAAFRGIPSLFRDKSRSRALLTEGIMTGLSFLLASEVLNTLIAPDWKEIGMTCAILVMRAGVHFLVAWEKKSE